MSKLLEFSGLAGAVLTLFGLIAFFFTESAADLYVLTHLILGVLFLAAYFWTQGRNLLGSFSRRSTRYGIHSGLYSLLLVGILVLVNFLNGRYHYRFDLTEMKVFSLSPQTVKVLGQLKQELEIYGFFERGENAKASDLVKSYAYHSKQVKFTAVDPDRHPEMVKQFKVQQLNTLHVRYGQESMNVTETTEEGITKALIKLTKATKKNILFLTGHGEPKIEDREAPQGFAAAKEALENENYQVKELLLSTQEKVPAESSALIIAAPEKPLVGHELAAIESYVKNGGRLLVLLPSPGGETMKNFLATWGVEVGEDIVVDQVIRLFAGPSLGVEPIAETYSPAHPITRGFKERTLFPLVRSVEEAQSVKGGVEVTSLVKTGPASWAEKDVNGIFKQGKAALGPEDKKGPISIGVAVSANLKKLGIEKEGDAKIVVLGTAAFANNRSIGNFFNRDFFLNAVNWLVGQEEMISIRARSVRASRVQLTGSEGAMVFYLSFLILPELLLLSGLAVWWRRR